MLLPSGQRMRLLQDTALRFLHTGRAIEIESMTGYVSQVEFADGHVPAQADGGDRKATASPKRERTRDEKQGTLL